MTAHWPLLVAVLTIMACTPEEIVPPIDTDTGNKIINANITENTIWYADTVYELSGRVAVINNATLTIQPGTIIKSQPGSGAAATSLIISRGSKIFAVGTVDKPIIFTSTADELHLDDTRVGVYSSPNIPSNVSGLWGGLIILGYAPISASTTESQIEGIPTSDMSGRYGGNDPQDNSGIIQFVSIRHGGTNIGAGNEVNGLTLGGVGSQTIVDNVEIVANQDDGIELFGGTVTVTNILVWNAGDDGIDTDQGWSGVIDNFAVVSPAGHCLELDGPEGTLIAAHVIRNGTIRANHNGIYSMDLINLDDNSRVTLQNINITDIRYGQTINRTQFTEGEVIFNNVQLNVPADSLSYYINGEITTGIYANNTQLCNALAFDWTWCSAAGALPE